MDQRNRYAPWGTAVAVVTVCIAGLVAATFGGVGVSVADAASRPAADAPVDVVHAPVSAVPVRDPACRTCTLGAAKGWL